MLFSLQAATAGTAAPNPFVSDFSPAPGGQHETTSSNVGGGLNLLDEQSGKGDTGDLFGTDLFGAGEAVLKPTDSSGVEEGKGVEEVKLGESGMSETVRPPPPRPPPPATTGGTPRAISPVPASGSPAPSKSAFDDLNDSIRAALGGSPTRPPPPAGVSQSPVPSTFPIQTGFGGFDVTSQVQGVMTGGAGGMVFSQPPSSVPVGFGSPAKQGIGMTGDV